MYILRQFEILIICMHAINFRSINAVFWSEVKKKLNHPRLCSLPGHVSIILLCGLIRDLLGMKSPVHTGYV